MFFVDPFCNPFFFFFSLSLRKCPLFLCHQQKKQMSRKVSIVDPNHLQHHSPERVGAATNYSPSPASSFQNQQTSSLFTQMSPASIKATKLLKAAQGDPVSVKGAEAFEEIWRMGVGGDAILGAIFANADQRENNASAKAQQQTKANVTEKDKKPSSLKPAVPTIAELKKQQKQHHADNKENVNVSQVTRVVLTTQQAPTTTMPTTSARNSRYSSLPSFIEDPGSAFEGIPENVLTAAERSAISAQFQDNSNNNIGNTSSSASSSSALVHSSSSSGSLLVPRDLTKIRIGLSAAMKISVGIPDDTLYDLLIVGKVGIFLLKQIKVNYLVRKNSTKETSEMQTNENKNPFASQQQQKEESKNASSSQQQQQTEITIQTLFDVAKWIKFQLDSCCKLPLEAFTSQTSSNRDRLECLNSEVSDSLSLFEAASTSAVGNQRNLNVVGKQTSNNNNNNTNIISPVQQQPSSLNNTMGSTFKSAVSQAAAASAANASSSSSAQIRLTPRAALASVLCEPPAAQQQKQKNKKEKDSRREGSRRGTSPSVSMKQQRRGTTTFADQQSSQQHSSSSSSDSDFLDDDVSKKQNRETPLIEEEDDLMAKR